MRSVVATFRQHALRASDRMCVSWAMWAATAALSAGNVSCVDLSGRAVLRVTRCASLRSPGCYDPPQGVFSTL